MRRVKGGGMLKRKVKRRAKRAVAIGALTRVRPRQIVGHGDYFAGFGKKRVDDPFTGFGAKMGEDLLGKPGKYLGGGLQWLSKKLFGFGDYKVSSNSIMMGNDPPVFASSGRGTLIRHREYIGDIVSSGSTGTFNIQAFPLNAGIPATFPWLATIADSFEQYCIRGAVFEYKTMSCDALNSVNTALGTVAIATQYNSISAPFVSIQQMLNHEFSTSVKPSDSCVHPIECARGETPVSCLYTRTGAVPAGADQRLYDLGVCYVATEGLQGSSVDVGQLWVTYDVELLKPQLNLNIVETGMDHYALGVTGLAGSTGAMFGSAQTINENNIGTFIPTGTSQINFLAFLSPCTYSVEYGVIGATGTTLTTATSITASGGMTGASILQNSGQIQYSSPAGYSGTVQQTMRYYNYIPQSPPTQGVLVFNAATLPNAIAAGDLIIKQLPYGTK